MKKLIAVILTLAMLLSIVPVMAESAIDTSEHVKIVYLGSAGSSGLTGRPSTTWPWPPRAATST